MLKTKTNLDSNSICLLSVSLSSIYFSCFLMLYISVQDSVSTNYFPIYVRLDQILSSKEKIQWTNFLKAIAKTKHSFNAAKDLNTSQKKVREKAGHPLKWITSSYNFTYQVVIVPFLFFNFSPKSLVYKTERTKVLFPKEKCTSSLLFLFFLVQNMPNIFRITIYYIFLFFFSFLHTLLRITTHTVAAFRQSYQWRDILFSTSLKIGLSSHKTGLTTKFW